MKINVMYSCNEAYIKHTGVSMISLFENNKNFKEINVYFIALEVSKKSKEILYEIAEKYGRNLIIIDFYQLCERLTTNNTDGHKHPDTVYSKIFSTEILNIDKILYIDSDSIISNSLEEVWNLDMTNYLIAGVQSPASKDLKEFVEMKRDDRYICDAFVLMNLKKCREIRLLDKSIEIINEYNGNPPGISEGLLNKICKNQILFLEPKYNLMSHMILFNSSQIKKLANIEVYYSDEQIEYARENPVFIHYLNEVYGRPWNRTSNHPYKNEYLKYLNISPWKNQLEDKKLPLRTVLTTIAIKYLPFFVYENLRKITINSKKY